MYLNRASVLWMPYAFIFLFNIILIIGQIYYKRD